MPGGHPYESSPPSGDIATVSLTPTRGDGDGDGDALSFFWTKVSGPGVVTFADPGSENTTAGFSAIGTYTLRLTVDDGYTTSTDDIVITVHTAFDAWVEANGGGSVTFSGDANDDGIADGLAWLLDSATPATPARSLLPTVQESSGDLISTFRMLKSTARGTGVLKLQYSKDLGMTDLWTDHSITVPDSNSTVGGVDFVITPHATEDYNEVEAALPASAAEGGSKLFMRLLGELPSP